MTNVKLIMRHGTAAQWSGAVLATGEIGIEMGHSAGTSTDYNLWMKCGDGETSWENLPYLTASPVIASEIASGATGAASAGQVYNNFVRFVANSSVASAQIATMTTDDVLLATGSSQPVFAKQQDFNTYNELHDELRLNSVYMLGNQSNVSFTLPEMEQDNLYFLNSNITIVFYSTQTAPTLDISGTYLGAPPTLTPNTRYKLYFVWDGKYWTLEASTIALPENS